MISWCHPPAPTTVPSHSESGMTASSGTVAVRFPRVRVRVSVRRRSALPFCSEGCWAVAWVFSSAAARSACTGQRQIRQGCKDLLPAEAQMYWMQRASLMPSP